MCRQRSRHRLIIQEHSVQQYLARRFGPDVPQPKPRDARELAEESYLSGVMLTREEAMRRIRGPIRPWRHRFYRSDGTGPGVWIGRWTGGMQEQVKTYLGPKRFRTWPHPCRIPLVRRRACA